MATVHGKGGSITVAGLAPLSTVTSWSADLGCDLADISSLGGAAKRYFPGMKNWTATVEAIWEDGWVAADTTALLGASCVLELIIIADADRLDGTAYCSGISTSVGTDDVVKATYTFQGTGAIAWSAT